VPPLTSTEDVLELKCDIYATTNCMTVGIMNALNHNVEKHSPSLGRQMTYMQRSQLTRLPSYLTVHMDRCTRQGDTNEKAKLTHKVEFPLEFDALEFVTDELKEKLAHMRHRLRELKETRVERRDESRRNKGGAALFTRTFSQAISAAMSSETGRATIGIYDSDIQRAIREENEVLEDEMTIQARERREVEELVDQELRDDVGSSVSGMYDLVAIIAHEGVAADGGHYITLVKKSVFAQSLLAAEDNEDWFKFDDDDVSVFPAAGLSMLVGGGEDSSAYILLYKSVFA